MKIRDAIKECASRRLAEGRYVVPTPVPEQARALAVELFMIEPRSRGLVVREQWERDAELVREALLRLKEDGALIGDWP